MKLSATQKPLLPLRPCVVALKSLALAVNRQQATVNHPPSPVVCLAGDCFAPLAMTLTTTIDYNFF
jgi:hypothetical protein